ncbi:sugar phosphate isomerase/epimerase family protein [Paenibacillus flagellatus]|uniref:Sugar phosphate isomerase/epimerase n=1 Tax=Paenibacillus flagellatus TaxID=2211139 RepID=A0A2V5K8I2_9BACL|nr:sugar phosphate isomerase/epimerase family protein [Paenibacillus flagellatus]PYI55825.1 sugar phosphate isomerase/epimerase [Paenibacillus flagellatus]
MKIGVSTYSLARAINAGEMDVLGAIQWIADNGGQHVEIVPIGYTLDDNPALVDAIVNKAAEVGIDISNYAIGANFVNGDEAHFANELERVKKQVDIANRLGVKRMRHDVAGRPVAETGTAQFEADFATIVRACAEIADYASQYGIVTSIENHGFFVQATERVHRIIEAVNRPNFRHTVDIGNFLCVDENPVSAVKKSMPYASMVHFKDFYVRPSYRNPGDGWFTSTAGNYLRGAVVGQGDIDMYEVVRIVKASGYDSYVSIEFEGREECKWGTKTAMDNAIRIWNEV